MSEEPRFRAWPCRPVGVLAVQGDFAAHGNALERAGCNWVEVRYPNQVYEISGLVLPGGESTTVSKFLSKDGFAERVAEAAAAGMPLYGSCAGAIILSREVIGGGSLALGLIDIAVERNAYGRQIDSFVARTLCPALGPPELEMVFIRAPIVRKVGEGVEVLATWRGDPVFLKQRSVIVTTFHPELSEDLRVHRLFAEEVLKAEGKL